MATIKFDIGKLADGISSFDKKFQTALMMYADTKSVELKSYMKKNRPWTDRTGQAKRMLDTEAQKTITGAKIALSHGVDYGIWLELAHEKRFAIIEPTIRLKGPEVINGLSGLMSKIK